MTLARHAGAVVDVTYVESVLYRSVLLQREIFEPRARLEHVNIVDVLSREALRYHEGPCLGRRGACPDGHASQQANEGTGFDSHHIQSLYVLQKYTTVLTILSYTLPRSEGAVFTEQRV